MAKKFLNILFVVCIGLFLISCSASSYSKRYDKPVPKEEKKNDKLVRFSSDDNLLEKKAKPKSAKVKPQRENPAKSKTSKPKAGKVDVNDNPNFTEEFDEEPYDDVPIDKNEFIKKNKIPSVLYTTLTRREKLLFEVVSYLETPYQYGGQTYDGIDCSAFTQNVYRKALEKQIPRTAKAQFAKGKLVSGTPEFGDLIFFNTSRRAYPGHVGIYLGNDLFAHASSSKGVIISSLKSTYYSQRYIAAKRLYQIK